MSKCECNDVCEKVAGCKPVEHGFNNSDLIALRGNGSREKMDLQFSQQESVKVFIGQVGLTKIKDDFRCPARKIMKCNRSRIHAMVPPYYSELYKFILHEVMGNGETEVVWNDKYGRSAKSFVGYVQVVSDKTSSL